MPTITPSLWFDDNVEEAIAFYSAIFPNSAVESVERYTEAGPGTPGQVLAATFTLDGQRFIGINGGPQFPFTEAVSFEVRCDTQEEIDRLWAALVEGGKPGPCGWLTDRYGLSWQISSSELVEMITDPDQEKVNRVTQAFLQVDGEPYDLAALRAAFEGTAR